MQQVLETDPTSTKPVFTHGGKRPGAGRKPKTPHALIITFDDPTPRWHVVKTEAGMEFTAYELIRRLGFEVFFPREIKPGRAEGRSTTGRVIPARPTVIAPLFRGYLFVRFVASVPNWRYIPGLRGVSSIFGLTPDHPTPVSDNAIQVVRDQLDEREMLIIPGMEKIARGASVVVVGGPFDGLKGLALKSDTERCSVLLNVFGRDTATDIPRRNIAIVTTQKAKSQ